MRKVPGNKNTEQKHILQATGRNTMVQWKGRRTPAYAEASISFHLHVWSCVFSLQESVKGSSSSQWPHSFCLSMSWCMQWCHHLLPPTFLSNSMARHPGSCAWCPLSKSAYILRNEKITDLIYLLKASYHLHGEAVLRHLVSSLSDFFFFFFYLLDDRLQALFHSAPKGTGNNPQYHFDLVCLLQIR